MSRVCRLKNAGTDTLRLTDVMPACGGNRHDDLEITDS